MTWMTHQATLRMIGQGHRRIEVQPLSRRDHSTHMREGGHLRALADAGSAPDPVLTGHDVFTIQAAEAFFSRLLAGRNAPTALICANELELMGAPGRCVGMACRGGAT
jgi:LacI family transcriptional regulator